MYTRNGITTVFGLIFFACLLVGAPLAFAQPADNSYLADIVIKGFEFDPAFRKTTLFYQMEVPEEVTVLDITATPEDSAAEVTIKGATGLQPGRNTVTITVQAQDGSTTPYELVVVRAGAVDDTDTSLQQLSAIDYTIEPAFSPDIYEYAVSVHYYTESIEIVAVPNNPDAQVTIDGTDNLIVGQNTVLVRVISPQGDIQETYTILVDRPEEPEPAEAPISVESNSLIPFALMAIVGLALGFSLAEAIRTVARRRKQKGRG